MTIKEILKIFDEFIVAGINLTRRAQEDDAPYWNDPDHLQNTFRSYNDWRYKIQKFIRNQKINSDTADFFFEADSVPTVTGLGKYRMDENKSWELLKNVRQETSKKLECLRKLKTEFLTTKNENHLKSIHLITDSLEPKSVIFLILDGHYDIPIRFAVKNKKGQPTYIKRLWDIAYIADAPGKKVAYSKRMSDGINNDIFKKARVKKYMGTNVFEKPTLVKKSEDGSSLVLTNEIEVETGRIKNNVPLQFQRRYYDKTK